jgi:hypothetical protein
MESSGGIIFTLLLATNHDAKPGSHRRKYIEELTGTVIFDILDCDKNQATGLIGRFPESDTVTFSTPQVCACFRYLYEK